VDLIADNERNAEELKYEMFATESAGQVYKRGAHHCEPNVENNLARHTLPTKQGEIKLYVRQNVELIGLRHFNFDVSSSWRAQLRGSSDFVTIFFIGFF
jgi:hypothetical protein